MQKKQVLALLLLAGVLTSFTACGGIPSASPAAEASPAVTQSASPAPQPQSASPLSANAQLVAQLVEQSPADWAEHFAPGALYRFSSGSQPEPREDEVNRAYQITAEEYFSQVPEDLRYSNPFQASFLFTRVDTEGLAGYQEVTGHYAYDQGKCNDYQAGYEDTVFSDTVIAKRQACWTENGQERMEYRYLEFNFNEDGQIVLLREIEDTVQEANWLAEYNAGTYASRVNGQVITGADIDAYESVYPSTQALLAANLSTIGKWWDGVGYYRCWLRFPLATEDATMGVNYLMYADQLFDDPVEQEALYYDQAYSRDTLGGNRVVTCWKQGWLNKPEPSSTWGWVDDNRVYVCADDPNVIISDSVNTLGGHMYLLFTMRDGLVRDFRETRLWFEAMENNTFEQVTPGRNDPDYHG